MSESEYPSLVQLLGRFVTAKIKGEEEARQGWIVEIDPFVIQDRSGTRHECEGYPTLVSNPPKKGRVRDQVTIWQSPLYY